MQVDCEEKDPDGVEILSGLRFLVKGFFSTCLISDGGSPHKAEETEETEITLIFSPALFFGMVVSPKNSLNNKGDLLKKSWRTVKNMLKNEAVCFYYD